MKKMVKIAKIVASIIFSFSIPLILPVIAQILIKIKIFNNFEELKIMLSQFYNFYAIIYILIGFAIILYFDKKIKGIGKIIKDIKISLEIGNNKITIESNKHSRNQNIIELK